MTNRTALIALRDAVVEGESTADTSARALLIATLNALIEGGADDRT